MTEPRPTVCRVEFGDDCEHRIDDSTHHSCGLPVSATVSHRRHRCGCGVWEPRPAASEENPSA